MTSLAAVHTAAAIVVRALGDAGVSAEVTVTFDTNGIVVAPKPRIDTVDWQTVVLVLADLTHGNGSTLSISGVIDGIPVTASWWALGVAS